jgi:NADH dehydrogenase
MLISMRTLPAVPVSTDSHLMSPVWHEDLSEIIATQVATERWRSDQLDVIGPDQVTWRELYDLLADMTDRHPIRIPLPDFVGRYGALLADALGLSTPIDPSWLSPQTRHSAPGSWTVQTSTPIHAGMPRVLHELDEVTPQDGVGRVEVKRFFGDIRTSLSKSEVLRLVRARFKDVMPVPVGVEPATPEVQLVEGAVISMALPGRGHVQVRVEEVSDDHVVLATLRGHTVAGIVRFSTTTVPEGVRFEVLTCDSAANALDWIALTLGGARGQDANWTRVVHNVASLVGSPVDEVRQIVHKLGERETEDAREWIHQIIQAHRARHGRTAVPYGATIGSPETAAKRITRKTQRRHAMLDYGVAAAFLAAGYAFIPHHRGAAKLLVLNGAIVLGMSVLTNYRSDVVRTR